MGKKSNLLHSLALLLALIMVMSCFPTGAMGTPAREAPLVEEPPGAPEEAAEPERADSGLLTGDPNALHTAFETQACQDAELVRVLVELDQRPLVGTEHAMQDGTLTALGRSLQQNALDEHRTVQAAVTSLDENVQFRYDYTVLFNGFAMECPYGMLDQVRSLNGVRSVEVCQTYSLPVEPLMDSSNDMIGSQAAWNLGVDGSGIVVAVLDTGLDTDHDAFAMAPSSPKVTRETVECILKDQSLQAEKRTAVEAQDVYLSAKVPFVFDYAGGDTDVNHHGGSDHGTHVAGTIAAAPTDGTISGVAPQAQLMILKVFDDGSTGASSDDILAALEDCVMLGVDVVNLSLGSPAGFTQRPDLLSTMEVYTRLEQAGIAVVAAAGNEYSAAYGNQWETDLSLASNPDYGIVGAPSSYVQTLSVASADNRLVRSAYFQVGERKITFTDMAATYAPEGQLVRVLGGQTLPYVVIPGNGTEADYEGLDVSGKVALVCRGGNTFPEKQEAALAKGASACIVYNNAPGLLNMAITSYPIPTVFISQSDGQAMAGSAENGVGILTVATDTVQLPAETGGQPSDFSSWGTTARLEITPDLMAPGGNIYSSKDNNTYGVMSGTSMATPHVAGASALMLQYLRSGDLASDLQDLTYPLLMCTASPARDASDTPYSPRKQGAGLVNVAAALETRAYLQVPGSTRPKLELGDDPARDGVYQMTFQVVNFGQEPLYYAISPTVLTETATMGGQYGGQDVYFAAQKSRNITQDVTWTTDWPQNVVTVPAGQNVSVTVTVTLSEALKRELTATFENGIYIEGYVTLVQQTTNEGAQGCNLSVPFLAFFGDWNQAPVIDTGYYWELLNGETSWSSQYTNYGGSMIRGTANFYVFGANPYVSGLAYYPEHNTLSPMRTDGYFDQVDLVYTALLRNAKSLTYRITNAKTGEVYYRKTVDYVAKSVYHANYQTILPAGAFSSDAIDPWGGTDSAGELLDDGTTALVTIDAVLDSPNFHPEENRNAHWEFPVTIDNTLPSLVSSRSDGKTLTLELRDNQYLAYVEAYDGTHMGIFAEPIFSQGFSSKQAGETVTVQMSVAGVETVYLGIADYGRNERILMLDAATGQVLEGSQFEYFEDHGEVTITGYTGSELDVVIPDEIAGYPVIAIAENAFLLSRTIQTVTIGKHVTAIGPKAFSRCDSLRGIYVAEGNTMFQSLDGVLYTRDGKTLLSYPGGKAYENYPVASGTEVIASYAFFYAPVQKVFLPDSLREIEDYGFYYATNLTAINMPKALTTLGDSAFFACYNLREVQVPATITNIGAAVWSACTSLQEICVDEANPNYCALDGVLYSKDRQVLKVYPYAKSGDAFLLPDTVEEIGPYAFYSTGLTTVTVPDTLRTIGAYAFYGCSGLTAVPVSFGLETIGDYAFYSCKALPVLDLPDSVETIGAYAFAWCSGLARANLGEGLVSTGKYAFFYCSGLTEVRLGEAMETLGNYTFYKCSKLAAIDLGNHLREVGTAAFSGCTKLTSVALPDSMRLVEASAFNGCSGVTSLDLGQGVEEIGASAFAGLSKITSLTLPDSLRKVGNSAFSKASNLLTLQLSPQTREYGSGVFAHAAKLPEVILPEGMAEVPDSMFANCTALSSVSVAQSVTVIRAGAFRSCKSLSSLALPDKLLTIEDSAFYSCTGLTSVSIPDQVTEVGNHAFYGLNQLTELHIGAGVKTIGNFAFYGCTKLPSLTLPDSVKSLGISAFNKNSVLTAVSFGAGLESIGSMCFNMCYQLEGFTVPESNGAFAAQDGILYSKTMDTLVWYPQGKGDSAYTMPDTVKHVGAYGIYEVKALTSLTVSPVLESIDEFGLARLHITGILDLPATVHTIHVKAFLYDYNLQGLRIPTENETFRTEDGVLFTKDFTRLLSYPAGRVTECYTVSTEVTTIGTYAFYANQGVQAICCSHVARIEPYALYSAQDLTLADLGNSVEFVDAYAFYGCGNLQQLLGTEALREVGESAFSSCDIRFALLPHAVTIGSSAFSFNRAMTRAVIGPAVEAIYASAFNYCSALTQAYFLGARPDNVGRNAFNKAAAGFTVYYDAAQAGSWAPGGETQWGSYPIAPATFCTVTFLDVDHRILLKQPVAQGHGAIEPQPPVRPEATFTGWSADSSLVTQDMTVIAQYEGLKDVITVTAQAGAHGSISPAGETTCYYDGSLTYTFTPDEGYYVEHVWVNGQDLGSLPQYTFQNLRQDSTISVTFAIYTYTVTFADGLDGQIFARQVVEYGENATMPALQPHHEGYHFTGWDHDGSAITADRTITAQYARNVYTVVFLHPDGTELSRQSVSHGQAAVPPEAPDWEGHTFAGWSGDTSCVVGDMTVTALYTTNSYTVFFTDWDGTVLKTQEVPYGEGAQAPEAPTREGHAFLGWSTDFSCVTASLIVRAQYEKNRYTVRFVDFDGRELSVQTVAWGEAATAPEEPVREGYTFLGWDTAFTAVTQELQITAQYEINVYTVRFVDFDGRELSVQTVEWGQAAAAPEEPSREGHTFAGWDRDFAAVTEDLTVTAQYRKNTYTVRFVDFDGRELSVQTVAWGEAAEAPAPPVRTGYEFAGWDTAFDRVTSDLTVTARYTAYLPFDDVDRDAWYYEPIRWAYACGMMVGMGDGTFRPLGTATRAQFVTILYRASGETAPEKPSGFTDVPQDAYYAEAVAWAAAHGIVQGTSETTFHPNAQVTREQAVTFLYRYAQYQAMDVTASGDLDSFSDGNAVHSWAMEAVIWAVDRGILQGTDDGCLAPCAVANRAQCAALLMRFCRL